MDIIHLTEDTFEETIADGTVLVDFWATWCGPCRMLAPTIEKLAEEYPDVKVCKVDVDENQGLAMEYRIMSIPTVMIFKDGELAETFIGVRPIDDFRRALA